MRCLVMLLISLLSSCATAAAVVWNFVDVETYLVDGRKMILLTNYYSSRAPYMEISLWYSNGSVGVNALRPTDPVIDVLYYKASLAEVGDVVNSDNLARSPRPMGGSDVHPAYQYAQEQGRNFYIMFETGTVYNEKNPYFGWAELSISEQGDLSRVRIMADRDHNWVVVGRGSPIPEPRTDVLLLFGLGALGLRRRIRDPRSGWSCV